MHFNDRESIIALTPMWKGERLPDGRPKVEDKYLDALYGMTLEELETEVAAMAEAQVMTEVLYQYIAEKEGIVATEEDYLDMVAQYMEAYGYTDMTSFVNDYGVEVVEKQGYADATFQLVKEFCYDKAIKTEAPAEETTASAE